MTNSQNNASNTGSNPNSLGPAITRCMLSWTNLEETTDVLDLATVTKVNPPDGKRWHLPTAEQWRLRDIKASLENSSVQPTIICTNVPGGPIPASVMHGARNDRGQLTKIIRNDSSFFLYHRLIAQRQTAAFNIGSGQYDTWLHLVEGSNVDIFAQPEGETRIVEIAGKARRFEDRLLSEGRVLSGWESESFPFSRRLTMGNSEVRLPKGYYALGFSDNTLLELGHVVPESLPTSKR